MKYKIFTIALVGAGLLTTLALKPAMATESCPLQNGYQYSDQSNGYVQVKGGRHHSRGGHHRNDYYQNNQGQHRGGNPRRRNHNNTWYFIDGVLRQLHNFHRAGRHQSNSQHHNSPYYK
jgi:hypothetical protein